MKKTTVLVGVLIISVSLVCFSGLGRTGELQQRILVRKAVAKVLASQSFTPPITLEGPNGVVWYVGCRSGTPLAAEQAIVRVQGGNAVSVELVPFHREKKDDPWTALIKSHNAIFLALERNMKEQLEKELAAGEASAKPETDKANAK